MWVSFTERAKRAVGFAQAEAARRGDRFVGPEDLLLGALRQADTPAARALAGLGISIERIRSDIERRASPARESPAPVIQHSPRAKRVIDLVRGELQPLQNTDFQLT